MWSQNFAVRGVKKQDWLLYDTHFCKVLSVGTPFDGQSWIPRWCLLVSLNQMWDNYALCHHTKEVCALDMTMGQNNVKRDVWGNAHARTEHRSKCVGILTGQLGVLWTPLGLSTSSPVVANQILEHPTAQPKAVYQLGCQAQPREVTPAPRAPNVSISDTNCVWLSWVPLIYPSIYPLIYSPLVYLLILPLLPPPTRLKHS